MFHSEPSVANTDSFAFDKDLYVVREGDKATIQIGRESSTANPSGFGKLLTLVFLR